MIRNKENVYILLIVLTSIFFSISYSYEQVAIDGALAYAGFIKFPEGFSVMKANYFNQWTLLHQLPALFLKSNFSIIDTSRLILFFSTLFFFIGIYLTVKTITLSSFLAFFIALTVLMFRKNFGDVGYPTVIFSPHTYGMMSLSIVTLIFGLAANRNLFSAGFFSILLISIHLVVGAWITTVLLFSLMILKFFQENFVINKKIFYGMFLGLIAITISFVFFYLNISEAIITQIDRESYEIYLENWESHRTNWGNLHLFNYAYLAKSFLLIVTCIIYLIYFSKENSKQSRLLPVFILTSCFLSIFIYIVYKFFPNLFPELVINIIPSRFVLMYSVIGWPIIISTFFIIIKSLFYKIKINPTYATILILVILFSYSLTHYKNILIRSEKFVVNFNDDNRKYENNLFWNNVKKIKMNGYVLTSVSPRAYDVIRYANKPVLLNLESINLIPYAPNVSEEIKNIIEKVYGIPFHKPPIKYVPCIPENIIKKKFEKRPEAEWKKLSKEFNFNWIVLPVGWNIALNIEFKNDNYAFYDVNNNHDITLTDDLLYNHKERSKIESLINNCYPH